MMRWSALGSVRNASSHFLHFFCTTRKARWLPASPSKHLDKLGSCLLLLSPLFYFYFTAEGVSSLTGFLHAEIVQQHGLYRRSA